MEEHQYQWLKGLMEYMYPDIHLCKADWIEALSPNQGLKPEIFYTSDPSAKRGDQ